MLTKFVIGVRCPKCKLPGLLEQKPGHLCTACLEPLVEHKVNNTNCWWCTNNTICSACAQEAHRLIKRIDSPVNDQNVIKHSKEQIMFKEIAEQIPNIDGFSVDPNDYKTLAQEFMKLSDIFIELANYAKTKKTAMEKRNEGLILAASHLENQLDNMYKRLADEFKW